MVKTELMNGSLAIPVCIIGTPAPLWVSNKRWIKEVMGPSKVKGGNKVTGVDDVRWIDKVERATKNTSPWDKRDSGVVL